MDEKPIKSSTQDFENSLKKNEEDNYLLCLYVSGMSSSSLRAIQNIRDICQEHLKGRYRLEVIDVYQHPERGKDDQIVAAPTLIKKLPAPLRKFIGDLSDREKILVGLNLVPKGSAKKISG